MDPETLKQFQQFQLFQQSQQTKPKKQFNNINPHFSTTLSTTKPSGPNYKELSLDNDRLRKQNNILKDENDILRDENNKLKGELDKLKKINKSSTITSDDIKKITDSDISSINPTVINKGDDDIPIEVRLDSSYDIYQIINYIYKNDKYFIDPYHQLKLVLTDRIDKYSFYDNKVYIDDNLKNIFNEIVSYIKEITMQKIHITINKDKYNHCIICRKFDDSKKKSK